MKHSKKRSLVAGMVACAALVGTSAAAIEPASAAGPEKEITDITELFEFPGIGTIISTGMDIYTKVDDCQKNKKAGLDCMNTGDDNIRLTYEKLTAFIEEYHSDQVKTQAALSELSADMTDSAYEQQVLPVKADFKQSEIGLRIYKAYVECAANYVDGAAQCTNIDDQGNTDGKQEANPKNISELKTLFLDSQAPKNYRFNGADPLFQQVAGLREGAGVTSYGRGNVLGKLVNRERAIERRELGQPVGSALQVMGPDYVNRVGSLVTNVINAEGDVALARGLAANMDLAPGQPMKLGWQNAVDRGGDGREMGLTEQFRTYSFPGWTPEHQLKDDEAFVNIGGGKSVKITNHGLSENKPSSQNLVSPEQMAAITASIGPVAEKFQGKYPDVLPAKSGPVAYGNGTKSGSDDAVSRWWTAPQPTWEAHTGRNVKHLSDSNQCTKSDFTPVTVLGRVTRAHYQPDLTSHWKVRETNNFDTTSVPYSVFGRPTDTLRGWGDGDESQSAEADLAGTPFEDLGRQVAKGMGTDRGDGHFTVSLRPVASELHGVSQFQAPTWDTFARCSSNTSSHSSSHGPGVFVRVHGVVAANVTASAVDAAGLLVNP